MSATRPWLASAIVACIFATAALTFVAAGEGALPGDVWAARKFQAVTFAGSDRIERFGYQLGALNGILAVALPALVLLALARRFAEGLLIAAMLALRGTNPWLKDLFASPRPTPDLVRVIEGATGDPGSYGFPSGHTMGTTLLYGSLIYIAWLTIRPPRLRLAVQALAVLAISVTGLSRIYSGAHWPSDVVGGLLWGLSLLLPLIACHRLWRREAGPGRRAR